MSGFINNLFIPTVVTSVSISRHVKFVVSFFHHFVHLVLKSPVTIELKEVAGLCCSAEDLNLLKNF